MAGPQPRRAGQTCTAHPAPSARIRPRVADPANRARVFDWRLSQTTDPFGNRIEYEYLRDTSQDPSRPGTAVPAAGPLRRLRPRRRAALPGLGDVRLRAAPGPVLRLPRRLRDPDPAAVPPHRGAHPRRTTTLLVRSYELAYSDDTGVPDDRALRRTGSRCSARSGGRPRRRRHVRRCRRWSSATRASSSARRSIRPLAPTAAT